MKECIVLMGSTTQALRGQKILSRAGIRTEIVEADPAITNRGCAYALRYPCPAEESVKIILADAGVRARGYYGGDGT